MHTKATLFKKIGICILCFVLGFSAKYGMDYIHTLQIKKAVKPEIPFYVDKGKIKESITFHYDAEYGYRSTEWILQHNAIIPDAKTAAEVGVSILSSMYGREDIEREKPFEVRLANDSVWYVRGTHSLGRDTVGGRSRIIIQKMDGKVLNLNYAK